MLGGFGQGGLPGVAWVRSGCWLLLDPGRGRRDGGSGPGVTGVGCFIRAGGSTRAPSAGSGQVRLNRLSMSWEGRKGGRSRDRIRARKAGGIWEGLRGLLG